MAPRKSTDHRKTVTVRLPAKVVQEIDQDLEQRPVPLSRNNWLLEAAIEKLKRSDSKGARNGTK